MQAAPFARWRFYLAIPLADEMSEMINPASNTKPKPIFLLEHVRRTCFQQEFAIGDFSKAIETAARNEVRRELAVTSLALKRHYLRHGRFPDQLAQLVPAFISEVPVDWMDGKPLRYRLNEDGTYLLYSVGENGKDDGGNAGKSGPGYREPFDLVWSQPVPWEKQEGE